MIFVLAQRESHWCLTTQTCLLLFYSSTSLVPINTLLSFQSSTSKSVRFLSFFRSVLTRTRFCVFRSFSKPKTQISVRVKIGRFLVVSLPALKSAFSGCFPSRKQANNAGSSAGKNRQKTQQKTDRFRGRTLDVEKIIHRY